MDFKNLFYFVFLFKLMMINCLLIKNNKIIFKSNKIIKINGINYKELDCKEKFCTSIQEVTCNLNKSRSIVINSCLITNSDTLYFNETIPNDYIVCDDNNSLRCYIPLLSSINLNTEKQPKIAFSNLIEYMIPDTEPNSKWIYNSQIDKKINWDDDFDKRQREMEKQSKFIMIGFMVIFCLIFLLIISAICRGCCAEAGYDPCSSCKRDSKYLIFYVIIKLKKKLFSLYYLKATIISESARRVSFPRNNYPVTTTAVHLQTAPNYPMNYNSSIPQYLMIQYQKIKIVMVPHQVMILLLIKI